MVSRRLTGRDEECENSRRLKIVTVEVSRIDDRFINRLVGTDGHKKLVWLYNAIMGVVDAWEIQGTCPCAFSALAVILVTLPHEAPLLGTGLHMRCNEV